MPSLEDIQQFVKHSKTVIKNMRAKAKELNHQADALAKSNGVLIRQLKKVNPPVADQAVQIADQSVPQTVDVPISVSSENQTI